MVSDFPDPVVPATRPCGPWAFSWRFNSTISSSARNPRGTAKDLWDSPFSQRWGIFSSSRVFALYISKKVIDSGIWELIPCIWFKALKSLAINSKLTLPIRCSANSLLTSSPSFINKVAVSISSIIKTVFMFSGKFARFCAV